MSTNTVRLLAVDDESLGAFGVGGDGSASVRMPGVSPRDPRDIDIYKKWSAFRKPVGMDQSQTSGERAKKAGTVAFGGFLTRGFSSYLGTLTNDPVPHA